MAKGEKSLHQDIEQQNMPMFGGNDRIPEYREFRIGNKGNVISGCTPTAAAMLWILV